MPVTNCSSQAHGLVNYVIESAVLLVLLFTVLGAILLIACISSIRLVPTCRTGFFFQTDPSQLNRSQLCVSVLFTCDRSLNKFGQFFLYLCGLVMFSSEFFFLFFIRVHRVHLRYFF